VRLSELEQAMLGGALGEPRRLALEQQLAVGRFFDAPDMIEVSQAHLMADGEAVGEAGLALLERLASAPPAERRVRVPTVTDPRGVDPGACAWLRQPEAAPAREARIVRALEALGVLLTNTCVPYQVVAPPVAGEHLAMGDTGSAIYANSVLGARTNFEGGVAALWAGLTGRVPRYGMHQDRHRRGTALFEIDLEPGDWAEWGAIGALVGRHMRSYFDVPVLTGLAIRPGSDELKHLGAALASFGSTPLFHLVGTTPEAPDLAAAFDGPPPAAVRLTRADLEGFFRSFREGGDAVDLVVFAAPQLSLLEVERIARLLDGRRVDPGVALLLALPPAVAAEARRLGLAGRLEAAGARILEGVCFYQMYAREMGAAMGWRRLATNSAKLVNIIQGYGYEPVLQPTEACVEAACSGRLP
jgi:hypothetical protein